MKSKLVSIRFENPDFEKIRDMAKRLRIPVSTLIRLSSSQMLENGATQLVERGIQWGQIFIVDK